MILFEAGAKSTGHYGVTAAEMYALVTQTLCCDVSTMVRWLQGAPPLTLDAFQTYWEDGTEYNFLATPR